MQASYSPFQDPRSSSEVMPNFHYRLSNWLVISFVLSFFAIVHEYMYFVMLFRYKHIEVALTSVIPA
jgi:hypothetical protein